MSHQNSGNPAKLTRLQLEQHLKTEHPEEGTENIDTESLTTHDHTSRRT